MIHPETHVEIRRCFYAEHWKIGTIARELGIHPDAVRKAIESARFHRGQERVLPANLDDFLARATKARWSPHQMLEQLVQSEAAERSRRSLERRLRLSGIKSFKPMADFDWAWPTKIERGVIERALTLDFLHEGRNLVMVGRNGLGKTMMAQNICHAAVLAGSSV